MDGKKGITQYTGGRKDREGDNRKKEDEEEEVTDPDDLHKRFRFSNLSRTVSTSKRKVT